uniref:Uncharacterized protein n=2 Tax=Cyprinus carpio TaxID=7962 RepID=A0A8C1CCA5_CYPCA
MATFTVSLFLSLFGLSFSLYRKHFLVKERMTWEDAQKYCREHHYYYNQNKTWDESLNYCRQNYNDLVSLSSQIYMEEVINKTLTSQTAYVWTGLRFMAGHWFWVSGDDLQYKAWSVDGEIQCPAGNLRCGALDREEKLWKPTDCEERHNFLCLKKP